MRRPPVSAEIDTLRNLLQDIPVDGTPDATDPRHYKVLLVEDQEMEAAIIQAMLAKWGFPTRHFSDPVQAVKHLEETPYDFVLSDYMMPRMNGLQVLRRARYHAPDSVRIMITSKGDFDIAVDAINRGEVYRFIRKPVDERELHVAMRLAIEKMSMARELERLRTELNKRDASIRSLERGKR